MQHIIRIDGPAPSNRFLVREIIGKAELQALWCTDYEVAKGCAKALQEEYGGELFDHVAARQFEFGGSQ